MIKAILLDADGVVIKKHKYFSQRLREDGHNIPEEKVKPFFQNEYKKVAVGKADLKKEVSKYLKDWSWEGTIDELLEYWFSAENEIDQKVLDTIGKLRKKRFKCYLVSDHSKYRADDLLKNVGLGRYFNGAFFSGYVGYTKEERKFFEKVLKEIDLKPHEVLYFDDDPKNVDTAKSLGIKARVYVSFQELKKVLQKELE